MNIIGIAGPSCSGKSTLARALVARLPGGGAVIPMDAYYRDLSALSLEARARFNFDAPHAIEQGLLVRHLRALRRGESIHVPVYDYSRHLRSLDIQSIPPLPWILVEGVLLFYWRSVRSMLDLRFFLDIPLELCFERRLVRDVRERGRTECSVREQYQETVIPMYQEYASGTRQFAHRVFPEGHSVDVLVEGVLADIRAMGTS